MEESQLAVLNGAAQHPVEPADALSVLEHIVRLIEISLGTARKELEAVGSLLSEAKRPDSLEQCRTFAADNHVALYASQSVREERLNGHHGTPGIHIQRSYACC